MIHIYLQHSYNYISIIMMIYLYLSGKSKIWEELMLRFKSKGYPLAEFSLAWGRLVFSSIQAFN